MWFGRRAAIWNENVEQFAWNAPRDDPEYGKMVMASE
jgi:hypothetical protein